MTIRVSAIAVAELVSVTAATVDSVVAVTPEPGHVAATYGPGRRVAGVEIQRGADGDRIIVHVAVAFGSRLPSVGAAVRSAVARALTEHLPGEAAPIVDVHVAQVVVVDRDHEAITS